MLIAALRDLQWRKRRFAIAIVGTGLGYPAAYLLLALPALAVGMRFTFGRRADL